LFQQLLRLCKRGVRTVKRTLFVSESSVTAVAKTKLHVLTAFKHKLRGTAVVEHKHTTHVRTHRCPEPHTPTRRAETVLLGALYELLEYRSACV